MLPVPPTPHPLGFGTKGTEIGEEQPGLWRTWCVVWQTTGVIHFFPPKLPLPCLARHSSRSTGHPLAHLRFPHVPPDILRVQPHAAHPTPLRPFFDSIIFFSCDNVSFSSYQELIQKICCHGSCWKFPHIDRRTVNWPVRPHSPHRGHL